jgi:hypothetical protein
MYSSYICLALKGTHLMKVLLLVFELYNRKKEGKKPENLTSKHRHWSALVCVKYGKVMALFNGQVTQSELASSVCQEEEKS